MNDSEIYRKQGFGHPSGVGARALLKVARECRLPVAYTRIVYADHGADAGVFCLKAKGLEQFTEDFPGGQIVPALTPAPDEFVVRKTQPSAFFGTQLAPWFVSKAASEEMVRWPIDWA